MFLNGSRAETHDGANLAVTFAFTDPEHDLRFPRCEAERGQMAKVKRDGAGRQRRSSAAWFVIPRGRCSHKEGTVRIAKRA